MDRWFFLNSKTPRSLFFYKSKLCNLRRFLRKLSVVRVNQHGKYWPKYFFVDGRPPTFLIPDSTTESWKYGGKDPVGSRIVEIGGREENHGSSSPIDARTIQEEAMAEFRKVSLAVERREAIFEDEVPSSVSAKRTADQETKCIADKES